VAAGVNLADFDNVGDGGTGQPDGVFVVHAGPGGEQTSGNSPCVPGSYGGDIWSHQYYTSYGGQIVHYLIGPAESASTQTKTGLSPAGVWSHEFGHMLGLPDLYAPTTEPGFGVGCWDLMGYGIRSCWATGFTGDEPGNDPQEMSVWTRTQMEWAAPKDIADNACNRRVDPVEYGGETFKVTPDPAQPADYFLIEYRASVARDADLLPPNTSGNRNRVCVWHIDDHTASAFQPNEKACQPNENRTACKTNHYGVSLVEPDGNYSLEKGNAYAEAGDCLGPNAELSSAASGSAGTNYDAWPWSGKPASHWTVRTGALDDKASITMLVNDQVQNVAPEIQGNPPDAERGKLWRYQPKLAAAAGLPVWSLNRFPTGMTINAETGLIAWRVPSSFSADKVPVEIGVENCGGADAQKVNVFVTGGDETFLGRCGCSSRSGMVPLDALPFAVLLAVWIAIRLRNGRA
jgi:M6 family metalloprotease-like protein